MKALADSSVTPPVHFAESYNCKENYQPQNLCVVTRPRPFTPEEKVKVLQLINDLPQTASPMLSQLLQPKNPLTFYRHQFGKKRVNSRSFRRNALIYAWVPSSGHPSLHLTDLFFAAVENINTDFTLQHYFLLHEMCHLFDKKMNDLSLSTEFLNFYDWEMVDYGKPFMLSGVETRNQHWQLSAISTEDVEAFREQIRELHGLGKNEEADRLSFEFGQKYGHPGSYSMTNPRENFAEILTSELLDPQRMANVPTDVRLWLARLLASKYP